MESKYSSNNKLHLLGFIAVFATIFAILTYKAFTVPITHDEAWTLLDYTKYSVWDIMMYPDAWPNNHILNTILAKFSTAIFGMHDWSARLPNLLFFVVYAWGVFRLLKIVFQDRMYLFLPSALIFILSPYFLDFFALCRGYGISSGLTMLSLSLFVSAFDSMKQNHIWWAVSLALLASYANFTVLVFWAASVLVAALYFLLYKKSWAECWKRWVILAGMSIAYLALIAQPIIKMKSTNQFEYWTSKGFYEDTIFSVVHNSLSDSGVFTRADWVSKLVLFSTILLWILVVWILVKTRLNRASFQKPFVVVGIILFATVGVNLLQTFILNDPNLNGRTALFLVPIYSAFLVTAIYSIPRGKFRRLGPVIAGLIVLVAIQHLSTSIRLKSFKEWRFDAYTFDVLEEIEPESGEDVLLETHWLFNNSFRFYMLSEELPWLRVVDYRDQINVNSNADYYYIPREDVAKLEGRFKVVKEFKSGETLMKRAK